MHRLLKNIIILFSGLFIGLSLLYLQKLQEVKALDKPIPPPYVTCKGTDWPEWHSLRPYQASPCITEMPSDASRLCGKDLVVLDPIVVSPSDGSCKIHGDTATCKFDIERKFWISLNTFNSEFPIAGNTELISGGTHMDPSIEQRLSNWDNKKNLPPRYWEYDNFIEYLEDYYRWRGNSCALITIPIINKKILICFDNPLKPNFWANLFPYIPDSSTEDMEGKVVSSDMSNVPAGTDVTVENLITEWRPKPRDARNPETGNYESEIYVPHMQENVELTDILQTTYLSKDIIKEPQEIGKTKPVEIQSGCTIVNVRYNPGDQLFGEEIIADVKYHAVFECEFPVNQKTGKPHGTCEKKATFKSTVDTYTPLADELWSKTVAGNASVFKHIFPQTGSSPVEEIEDIPSVSPVDYKTDIRLLTWQPEIYFPHMGGVHEYFLLSIQRMLRPLGFQQYEPSVATKQMLTQPQQVNEYISWYFNGTEYRAENDPLDEESEKDADKVVNLTGPLNKLLPQSIQWEIKRAQIDRAAVDRHDQVAACTTGIRVFGYNLGAVPNACDTAGNLGPISISPITDICGQCNPDPTNVDLSGVEAKCVDLATRWLGAGVGNPREEECANVINASLAAGVDPIFTVAIWLHESGASNYSGICQVLGGSDPSSGYCQRILDFGVNDDAIATMIDAGGNVLADHFADQLNAFLGLPSWYISYCAGSTAKCPMEIFGSMYVMGSCTPDNSTNGYMAGIKNIYGWLSPGQLFPCYPIKI